MNVPTIIDQIYECLKYIELYQTFDPQMVNAPRGESWMMDIVTERKTIGIVVKLEHSQR